MSLSLRNNLTSQYLEAATRLSPKQKRRRIVAYVESYDDIFFWRSVLSEFEDETRYFRVMLPSNSSLSKGIPLSWLSLWGADVRWTSLP